jgi:hypothetical protein
MCQNLLVKRQMKWLELSTNKHRTIDFLYLDSYDFDATFPMIERANMSSNTFLRMVGKSLPKDIKSFLYEDKED